METFPPIRNKFLSVASAVIHPKHGRIIGRVLNSGATTRHLLIWTPIATISALNLNDPFNRAMLSMDASKSDTSDQVSDNAPLPT